MFVVAERGIAVVRIGSIGAGVGVGCFVEVGSGRRAMGGEQVLLVLMTETTAGLAVAAAAAAAAVVVVAAAAAAVSVSWRMTMHGNEQRLLGGSERVYAAMIAKVPAKLVGILLAAFVEILLAAVGSLSVAARAGSAEQLRPNLSKEHLEIELAAVSAFGLVKVCGDVVAEPRGLVQAAAPVSSIAE